MKAAWLPRSPIDALFLGLFFWLGSEVDQYLLSIGIGKPLYAYVALTLVTVGYLCMQGAKTGKFEVLGNRWTRRFLLWLVLYGMFGACIFPESSQSTVAIQYLIYVLEAVFLGGGFAILMLHPRRFHLAVSAFALLAVFATGLNLFGFFVPMFSSVPGRGAGFYINPNISGAFVPLAMLCGIGNVPRRIRWLFVLVCGIGVLSTFSRGAWLMWGVAVMWLGWHMGKTGSWRRTVRAFLGIVLGVWFIFALFFGELGSWLVGTSIASYLDSNTLARLGVGASSLSGFAAQQRIEVAAYAWHQAITAPWFGHGIGYVFEWEFPQGPHNMFLRFLVEGGLVGLLLYLGLLWLLWRAAEGVERVAVALFFIASFFSHNLLDQPEFILILTFIMVKAALRHRQRIEEAAWAHQDVTA